MFTRRLEETRNNHNFLSRFFLRDDSTDVGGQRGGSQKDGGDGTGTGTINPYR